MDKNLNVIDRAVNFFFPSWGTQRLAHRFAQRQFNHLSKSISGSVRRYEGAGAGRRTDNWNAPGTSAANEIQLALTTLRNRSRDLVRNNGYAKNAIRKIANNVVGPGILPNPTGKSSMQEKKLKQVWKLWAESTDCDFDGHNTFYGIQKLVMKTVVESGECLIRKRIISDKNLSLPLQLQVLEGDFIDTFKFDPQLENGGWIYYGIEFNKQGKVVAYWLYETHPGDSIRFNFKSNRYSTDEVIHVFEKERPGQYRGLPWLHSSMLRLKDLDEYEDAQLIRQKIAACFSVFITDNSVSVNPSMNNDQALLERVEPGIIEKLKPGQTVAFATPPGAEGYGEYTKNVLRGIAAGIGLDYVTLSGDLSATNFSSGRMGWLEFNRNITEWQWQMLIPMFCNKSWSWFTQFAAIYGLIKPNASIATEWTPPRREQINPEMETKATIEAVQNGIQTWSDAQLEQGYNPEEQLEKMKNDREAFIKANLPIYTDKSAMNIKETAPAKPDTTSLEDDVVNK